MNRFFYLVPPGPFGMCEPEKREKGDFFLVWNVETRSKSTSRMLNLFLHKSTKRKENFSTKKFLFFFAIWFETFRQINIKRVLKALLTTLIWCYLISLYPNQECRPVIIIIKFTRKQNKVRQFGCHKFSCLFCRVN